MAYNPKSFSEYLSEETKEITFVFGRFNPPTNGHEKVFDALKKQAGSGQFRIYASQSNDPKKNPLKFKDKIKFLRKMFPKYARNIMADSNIRTVFDIVTRLYDQGFTKVNMVVGEDRLSEFDKLLNKYNGEKGRHGFYQFEGGIKVISAGARDPDSDDVTGMSASKLRAAASANDFTAFSKGMPTGYKGGKELFNAIRKGMGLKESHNHRKHIQLETVSEEREDYINGNLFKEGDTIVVKESSDVGTITMTGSNYVLVEFSDGKKKRCWLDAVEKLDELQEAKKVIVRIELWNGKKMKKSFSNQSRAEKFIKKMQDEEDVRDYNMYAEENQKKEMPKSKYTKQYHDKFDEKVSVNKVYHTSPRKLKVSSKPMWFALDFKHAVGDNNDGWYYNTIDNRGRAYVYETNPKGNIAQYDDSKVKALFKNAKVDMDDYALELVENPSAPEVMAMKGTKLLIKNNYSGFVYMDYDPRDFQKDLPALIIFNPKKDSGTFKLVKQSESYNEQLDEDAADVKTALQNKSEKSGIAYSILKKVYERGEAAWQKSHRPGTNPQQWGLARVNSFIMKGKTWDTTDSDLAKKVRSESYDYDELDEMGMLSSMGLNKIDRYIDRVIKKPIYKKAVRFYLDQRKKSIGDTDNGKKIMIKTANITGLDYKNLSRTFHDMIKKGLLPKHLAFEDNSKSFKDYLKDNNK